MRGGMRQRVLQLVYDLFCDSGGTWPMLCDLQRALNRQVNGNMDAVLALRRIPATLLKPISSEVGYPNPSERVVLTAEGIERCKGSAEDIANFVIAVKWLARMGERKAIEEGRDGLRPTIGELAEAVSLSLESDSTSVNKLVEILVAEGLVMDNGGRRE